MEETTIKRFKKKSIFLCSIVGVLSLIIFLPQVRLFIIKCGEHIIGRPLTHDAWHKRFIKWEVYFLILLVTIYGLLCLIQKCTKLNISIYDFLITKIQTISNNQLFHIFTLFIFVIIICISHFSIIPSGDDVNVFNHALNDSSYVDFLKLRYNCWSSRLIIESVLINVYHFNFGVWRFLDIVAFVLIAECFIKLCFPQKEQYAILVYAIILLFTDFNSLHTAGWGATTVNYLWPLACTMPYFVMVKNIFEEKHISVKSILFSVLLLLFAINQEQVAALVFGLNLSFLFIDILKNRKFIINDSFFIFVLIICIFSLIFILTCPGNSKRFSAEVIAWFPEYADISFFEKIELGILTIFTYYFSLKNNFILIPLCFILTVYFRKQRKINFAFQLYLDIFILGCSFLRIFKKTFLLSNDKLAQFTNYSKIEVLIECIILILTGLILLYQIFNVFVNKLKGTFYLFLLIAGFCSAYIIAFSPTVYASGSRCYIFLSYTIFFVTLKCFYNIIEVRKNKIDFVS